MVGFWLLFQPTTCITIWPQDSLVYTTVKGAHVLNEEQHAPWGRGVLEPELTIFYL